MGWMPSLLEAALLQSPLLSLSTSSRAGTFSNPQQRGEWQSSVEKWETPVTAFQHLRGKVQRRGVRQRIKEKKEEEGETS